MSKCHSSTKLKNNINYFSRRGSLDIISSVLKMAKQGNSKTRIMNKCNLSYDQLKNYIQMLIAIGFLEKQSALEEMSVKFKATSKGLKFIRTYTELKAIMNLNVNRD